MEVNGGAATAGRHKEYFADRISIGVGQQIARRPCQLMSLCCGLMWAIVVGVMISGLLEFSEEGVKDWDVLDDKYVEDKDAILLAAKETDCLQAPDECPEVPTRSEIDYRRYGVQVMFRTLQEGAPVFTPERLQHICRVERVFFDSVAYPSYCQLRSGVIDYVDEFDITHCAPELGSVARYFYVAAGMELAECGLLPAELVDRVSQELHVGLDDPQQFSISGTFLGSDVYDSTRYTGGSTSRTKSQLGLGYPLPGQRLTSRSEVDRQEFNLYTEGFYEDYEKDLLRFFGVSHGFMRSAYWEKWTVGDLEVLVNAQGLYGLDTMRTINTDMLIAFVSIVFVGCFLGWRTGSAFIAVVSLWQIIVSVVLGFAVYRVLLQITFFHQLHGLLIFIILGIGADDIFVFSDAWWRSATEWKAEAVKSEGAGLSQEEDESVNNLAGRIAFAYKHAMVAVMNTSFTTGVAFLATAISPIMPIHSMGIYACLLVLLNYLLTITLTPATFAVWHTYGSKRWWPHCCCRRPRIACLERALDSGKGLDLIKTCFVPIFRYPAVSAVASLLLLGWGVANVVFAAQLEPPRESFKYFSDEHMFIKADHLSRYGYAAATEGAYNTLSITFGVEGVDRSVEPGMDKWKPHVWYGVPVYNPDFDFSTTESQDFLRSFCQDLRTVVCTAEGCQPIGYLVLQSASSVSCFMEEFDAWANGTRYEGTEFLEKLRIFRRDVPPAGTFVEDASWQDAIGFVDGTLKYVRVRAKMSLIAGQGESVKDPVRDLLESFLASQESAAPESVRPILQMVPFDWFWTTTTNALVSGLFTGFAICFPVAFLVLLVTTQNIIISIFAIVTVALIVACVLGYCYLAGWTLGIGESVAGIIVIGLSVDYTIHMGHMYLEAAAQGVEDRAGRWDYALRTMGITVLAGAVTTFFAGLVMQFCQIKFFNIMSTLIVLTISYSLVYTMCFFMGLMRIIGPQNKQGNVSRVCAVCRPQREPRGVPADPPHHKTEEMEGQSQGK